jgi:ribosomal protein L37AE/L43A
MDDCIVQHQDLNLEPYLTMVQRMYMGMGFGPLPAPIADNISGTIAAFISHGQWFANCPGCNDALVINLDELVYMCSVCGNVGNAGQWLRITVPANWQAIEAELLRRPWNGRNPAHAVNRNWTPGESVATLKQENADHGIGA